MPSPSPSPLCHLQSRSPSPPKPGFHSWSIFLSFKDGQGVTQKRERRGSEGRRRWGYALCKAGPSVAKVGRLRWGVSIARVHWCMNAAKSNASLDRQEGVGKVKPACRARAAVHRRQGATIPPSHSSITLPFLSFLFFALCSTFFLFISLCFFISNSLLLLPRLVPRKRPQP